MLDRCRSAAQTKLGHVTHAQIQDLKLQSHYLSAVSFSKSCEVPITTDLLKGKYN